MFLFVDLNCVSRGLQYLSIGWYVQILYDNIFFFSSLLYFAIIRIPRIFDIRNSYSYEKLCVVSRFSELARLLKDSYKIFMYTDVPYLFRVIFIFYICQRVLSVDWFIYICMIIILHLLLLYFPLIDISIYLWHRTKRTNYETNINRLLFTTIYN